MVRGRGAVAKAEGGHASTESLLRVEQSHRVELDDERVLWVAEGLRGRARKEGREGVVSRLRLQGNSVTQPAHLDQRVGEVLVHSVGRMSGIRPEVFAQLEEAQQPESVRIKART